MKIEHKCYQEHENEFKLAENLNLLWCSKQLQSVKNKIIADIPHGKQISTAFHEILVPV